METGCWLYEWECCHTTANTGRMLFTRRYNRALEPLKKDYLNCFLTPPLFCCLESFTFTLRHRKRSSARKCFPYDALIGCCSPLPSMALNAKNGQCDVHHYADNHQNSTGAAVGRVLSL